MRILILTHARSGGKSILDWIAKEKGFYGYHEPNIQNGNNLIKIIKEDNIVVKLFPSILNDSKIDIEEFVKLYDKVICHHREDLDDIAISMVYGNQRDNKNHNKWHEIYEITPEWIIENKTQIENKLKEVNKTIVELLNLNIDCLKTTYNGIFENKKDIDKLLQFLDIEQPFFLDILNKRHRLRNGNIGESDIKVYKPLI